MKDRAENTLKRLWVLVRRSEMRLVRGLTGSVITCLIVVRKDAHFLIVQECSDWERKILWSQKSELICSKVAPDLLSRSAGLSGPGHQNQLSEFVSAAISIILVP